MVRIKSIEKVKLIIIVLLILFGLIISYQLIKVILGGSWESEDIIISLLMFNLGAVFTIGLMLATFISNHKHLSSKFSYLAKDFKKHLEEHKK